MTAAQFTVDSPCDRCGDVNRGRRNVCMTCLTNKRRGMTSEAAWSIIGLNYDYITKKRGTDPQLVVWVQKRRTAFRVRATRDRAA